MTSKCTHLISITCSTVNKELQGIHMVLYVIFTTHRVITELSAFQCHPVQLVWEHPVQSVCEVSMCQVVTADA